MRGRLCIACMIGVMTGTTRVARAEPDRAEPDVVVTANRDVRATQRVAGNVSVVTAAQIERAGYGTVPEAIEDLTGVLFRSTTGNASQTEVNMRGFGENGHGRVLVLVDGRRLNRPDMAGINWLQIPIGQVARIEVVRGSRSVLYGDHALAGVVNVITRQGTPEPEWNAAFQLGSYGKNAVQAGYTGSRGPVSCAVHAGRRAADGYRDNSEYEAWGLGTKLGFDLSESVTLSAGLSYDAIDYALPGFLGKAEMDADPQQTLTPDDKASDAYVSAALGVKAACGSAGRLSVDLVYVQKSVESDMASWFSYADVTIDSFGVLPRFVLDRDLAGHANKLVVGLDCYMDLLDVERYGDEARTMPTTSADIEKQSIGLYARDDYDLSEALTVGVGGRVEAAEINGEMAGVFDDKKTHQQTAFDLGAVFRPCEGSKLFARAGTVYRYPFVDEQISYAGFGADELYSDIEPETGYNVELGSEWMASETLSGGLTVFLLEMDDEIAYNAMTMRNENLDRTQRIGAEAGVRYKLGEACELGLGYAYVQAQFTDGADDGNDLPLVPNHTANVALAVELPWHLRLVADLNYVGECRLGGDRANTGEKLSDYTVLDLALRYSGGAQKSVNAFVAVDNVLNEKYAAAAFQGFGTDGYYPSPELGVRAGASCRF